jgi:hypothetical protein
MTTQALSQVAAIILEQLGGIRRLALMISCKALEKPSAVSPQADS